MPQDFSELVPYRSFLMALVKAGHPLTPVVDAVLDDVSHLINSRDDLALDSRIDDTPQDGVRVGCIQYVATRSPGWSDGTVVDQISELVVVCRRGRWVAIHTSEKRMRGRLTRGFGDPTLSGLKSLGELDRETLNSAFVQGATRTLWLAGTHRRTTAKADSKILAGLNLRDSLNPLDDQSYYFSAARSVPDSIGSPVGVTPRRSSVWAGASSSWGEFVAGVKILLDQLEASSDSPVAQPLPIVATPTSEVGSVAGPFDISLQPPELEASPDLDEDERESLERWAYGSAFELTDPGPPIRANAYLDGTLLGTVELDLDMSNPDRIQCEVGGEAEGDDVEPVHAEALTHLRVSRRLKIRFESGHTLSDGAIYEQRFRDMPFTGFQFVDFADFNVKVEKPTPVTAVGEGQRSLFDWTFEFWPNLDGSTDRPGGFLVSDDGSMEIADFIHLDRTGAVPVISLIHVKAAGSDSPNRGISVSSYEVVTGQAIKNLRSLDQKILADGLAEGLGHLISQVAFLNRAPSTREAMIEELRTLGTNYARQVIIVQPHVTQARYETARVDPMSADAARLRQLDTLLLGAQADARSLGAEFLIVAAT